MPNLSWLTSLIVLAPVLARAAPPDPFAELERWPKPVLRPDRTEPEIAAAIADYAKTLADAGRFSGVVLAAHGDRIVVARAYGLADVAARTANTVETRFNVGSVDKLFTRAAIAQLAEAGKLALGDTVHQHLPALAIPGAAQITIQMLLDHRSGLGDLFGPRYEAAPPSRLRELADWVPLFVDQPLAFAPGSSERYSNAGFLVLGLIIERVSGERYRDYVARHVFAPAGMTRTSAWLLDDAAPDRATGYLQPDPAKPERAPNTPTLAGRSSSAGGSASTAGDLLRFWQALRANKLMSAAWTRWMVPADRPINLGGGAPGLNASMELADGWTVIALANLDPPAAIAVSHGAMDIIRGRPGQLRRRLGPR
jgi:CubicO group peptidase (beta-lactamase class C family)